MREQEQPVAGIDPDYFCRIVVADTHVSPALRKWVVGAEMTSVKVIVRNPGNAAAMQPESS